LVRQDEALRAAANWKTYTSTWQLHVRDDGRNQFRPRTSTRLLGFGGSCPHPVARAGHRARHRKSGRGFTENCERRLDLTGLPDPFPTESDWRAHWQ